MAIEEILQFEKEAGEIVGRARENGQKSLENAKKDRETKLASIISSFQSKKTDALEKQNKAHRANKAEFEKTLERDLEKIKEQFENKKNKAIDLVVSKIL